MDISKQAVEKIERKSLGEDCWINIGDDIRVRVDYMSKSQEIEFNRHVLAFETDHSEILHRHYIDFYLRATIKAVEGITLEGRETELESVNGLAMSLVTTDNKKSPQQKIDLIGTIVELGMTFILCGMIVEKLKFTEADKKKLQSVQDSVRKENSQEEAKSSSPAQS